VSSHSKGFVCSEECLGRADAIDRNLDNLAITQNSREMRRSFYFLALIAIVGALLIGEKPIFGSPSTPAKVIAGVCLCVFGLGYSLYLIYLK
jgi:hypothetical protein